jgi:uncharacterized C2H2 Zn-finger protein
MIVNANTMQPVNRCTECEMAFVKVNDYVHHMQLEHDVHIELTPSVSSKRVASTGQQGASTSHDLPYSSSDDEYTFDNADSSDDDDDNNNDDTMQASFQSIHVLVSDNECDLSTPDHSDDTVQASIHHTPKLVAAAQHSTSKLDDATEKQHRLKRCRQNNMTTTINTPPPTTPRQDDRREHRSKADRTLVVPMSQPVETSSKYSVQSSTGDDSSGIQCPKCYCVLADAHALREHHDEVCTRTCDVCDALEYKTVMREKWRRMRIEREASAPMVCGVCAKAFKWVPSLKRHMIKAHQITVDNNGVQIPPCTHMHTPNYTHVLALSHCTPPDLAPLALRKNSLSPHTFGV